MTLFSQIFDYSRVLGNDSTAYHTTTIAFVQRSVSIPTIMESWLKAKFTLERTVTHLAQVPLCKNPTKGNKPPVV